VAITFSFGNGWKKAGRRNGGTEKDVRNIYKMENGLGVVFMPSPHYPHHRVTTTTTTSNTTKAGKMPKATQGAPLPG